MTTPRISSLQGLAAAVAAQNNQSVAIPPGVSPKKAINLSQSNELKYRQWQAIQNNAPQGPLNLTQMMQDVTAEVCRGAVAKGEVVLTKDNSLMVVREDGMRLDPYNGKTYVADAADFPLARVDELYQRFAEKLNPHFDHAHFAQSNIVAENEMRLITEAHLEKLQRVLKQYENEALEKIWQERLAPRFHLENDPTLQTHEAIRAWINNPDNGQLLLQVTGLELSSLNLNALPPEIGSLTALQWLDLNNNQLTFLPPEIASLTALEGLYLHNNQLRSLPPEIGGLTALQEIHLSCNQLTSLPPEINGLTALRKLHLCLNQLTSLPPEIGGLTALQVLELQYNELTSLPPEISSLTALQELELHNNPWIFISNKIFEKPFTIQTILAHYQKFMVYPTKTALGMFLKLIASNAEAANIQNVFEELDSSLQQKIVQLAGITGTSAGPSTSSATIDDGLFTDIPRLGRAAREATMEMFNNLSQPQKNRVYGKIWELAGKPKTRNPKWGEHHARDEMLRFVDALEAVRAQAIME